MTELQFSFAFGRELLPSRKRLFADVTMKTQIP